MEEEVSCYSTTTRRTGGLTMMAIFDATVCLGFVCVCAFGVACDSDMRRVGAVGGVWSG